MQQSGWKSFTAALLLLWFLPIVAAGSQQCTSPSVRKEWRALTKDERADWISAVKCLAQLPHDPALTPYVRPDDIVPLNTSGSYYDDFVYMHMDLNHIIHSTGLFLPWHRWYVYVYEQALKTKCGFKGTSPYWNWSKDSHDLYDSPVFDNDPVSGLGGWGDFSDDIQVQTGGFGKESTFRLSYPSYHALRRNFTLQPYLAPGFPDYQNPTPDIKVNITFTPEEVSKLVNGFKGNYTGFQAYFEKLYGAHASVHFILGGDLGGQCPGGGIPTSCGGGPTFSANEPMFWLHHGMVDKVWYDWQHADDANTNIFFGGSVQAPADNETLFEEYPTGMPPYLNTSYSMPSEGLFPEATIEDVLSTTDGILCYVYE